ncbi:putative calcium transporter [Cladorrhinum samala]|uniref:Calcium transporter n=1 Tax=Cladorrhinum samala TaxID=585594 RepID=A0AAV9HTD0_9PEZI|nr:putative calcium transporter [Cladorrhinum samala]
MGFNSFPDHLLTYTLLSGRTWIWAFAKAHGPFSSPSHSTNNGLGRPPSSSTSCQVRNSDEPKQRDGHALPPPVPGSSRSGTKSLIPAAVVLAAVREILLSSYANILLIFVPVGIAVHAAHAPAGVVFAMNALAIVPLAGLLSHATESMASRMGDTVGALMNVTFGNAVELIIFIIALTKDQIRIVQASLVGSILANVLLILGMCFLLGGLKFSEQIYNKKATMTSSSLLALSVMSLLIPTVFHASFSKESTADDKVLLISHGTSVILLLIYLLYLVFQLKSHAHVYASMPQDVIELQSRPGPAARYFHSSSAEATTEVSGSGSSDEAIPDRPVNTTDKEEEEEEEEEEQTGRNTSSNPDQPHRPKKGKKRSKKFNKQQRNRSSAKMPSHTTAPLNNWQPQSQPRADFDLEAQRQPSDRSSSLSTTVIPPHPPLNPARSSLTFRLLPFMIPPDNLGPPAGFCSPDGIQANTSTLGDPSAAIATATAAAAAAAQAPSMSPTTSTILLLTSTTLVSLHAEFMISSVSSLLSSDPGGLSEAFIGLILLPVVGNAAEHVTAVSMALKNKMDLAVAVAVGSSIQISLFVIPLVVILGWAVQKEMSLFFTLFETVCVVASAFIVSFLVLDGRSNYLEGALLCAGYVIIAIAAFFYPDAGAANNLGSGIEGNGIS